MKTHYTASDWFDDEDFLMTKNEVYNVIEEL